MDSQFYLGTAMKRPVSLVAGKADIISGPEVIDQSIEDILSTPQGTRMMLPEYGSRLHEIMFEPNDEVLAGMLEMLITEAVRMWERRTRLISVQASPSEDANVMNCVIMHAPLASNEIRSFVYPFYKTLIY